MQLNKQQQGVVIMQFCCVQLLYI
ncbi:hypothetical protein Zm00014a_040927 [Zea mays]|uniref:Uncharacterized protein n=1 Tax=Zea mays TaxID=4577 RepID=A0A3L6EAU2_MAIZE|nr:hypothetical protein Zm00014a_040927 [Zea mays]